MTGAITISLTIIKIDIIIYNNLIQDLSLKTNEMRIPNLHWPNEISEINIFLKAIKIYL